MLLLLERASLQVLTSVDRKVHIINYDSYFPVPKNYYWNVSSSGTGNLISNSSEMPCRFGPFKLISELCDYQ